MLQCERYVRFDEFSEQTQQIVKTLTVGSHVFAFEYDINDDDSEWYVLCVLCDSIILRY
jgi:hypothetical protein